MQGMGSVVNGVWKPDVHAQGQFMFDQITALQGQLGSAQTPEEVQKIVSQIQALVSQLGGQQQDPQHYAESLKILAQILKDTKDAADKQLAGMKDKAVFDISTLGPKLAAAETVMAAALVKVQYDLDALVFHFESAATYAYTKLTEWGDKAAHDLTDLVFHFNSAADEVARKLKEWVDAVGVDITSLGLKLQGAETIMSAALGTVTTDLQTTIDAFNLAATSATVKLHDWGVEIADQLALLGPILTAMVVNFTDVNTALSGGGTGTGGGKGPLIPIGDGLNNLGAGVDDARGALVNFTTTVNAATAALGGKAA
jgi:hypothetical protein